VLKSPRPVVLLKEVDTYWLVFEIHFWMQHSSFMKYAMVQSQVLEAIGDMYRPPAEGETAAATSGAASDSGETSGNGADNTGAMENGDVSTADAATVAVEATSQPTRGSKSDPAAGGQPNEQSRMLNELKKLNGAAVAKGLKRLGSIRPRV